ncbi:MAG: 3-methyl-2-oxobutanoate hydroxymethyltransferase [Gammaproteobacteria bacterium]|nr:MAG: 3-methyl-2-oxobutanoate hydroxymethyltransferase [Gammaproteobacteria bacterium]
MAVTLHSLQERKRQRERFAVITAYDATFARAVCDAGAEVILVGDSLGMVLQGQDSTLPVTIEQMAYHTAAVTRGNTGALIIADMPFMSYDTPQHACLHAASLMRAGAHMVKLEGGHWLAETVTALVRNGIPVCAHLGLTPQSVNVFGGYRVQGRDEAAAGQIEADALALQAAGASLLVLECVPTPLASRITQQLSIPVIGIGAGNGTDAQVLVLHDLLGLNPKPARFVHNFMEGQSSIQDALAAYVAAVKDGSFPGPEHSFN